MIKLTQCHNNRKYTFQASHVLAYDVLQRETYYQNVYRIHRKKYLPHFYVYFSNGYINFLIQIMFYKSGILVSDEHLFDAHSIHRYYRSIFHILLNCKHKFYVIFAYDEINHFWFDIFLYKIDICIHLSDFYMMSLLFDHVL